MIQFNNIVKINGMKNKIKKNFGNIIDYITEDVESSNVDLSNLINELNYIII